MAKPLSMNLRERMVERVLRGESVRVVATALSISPASVARSFQRLRATGSAAPSKMGGNRPAKIVGEHRLWLLQRIDSGGFTLRGLVAELAKRGFKIDYRTMWKFVHSLGLSYKKRPSRQANSSGRTLPGAAPAGSSTSAGLTPGTWCSSTRSGPGPTWRRCAAGA
jgi:putative transposase